jgi:hypothetical protein
MLIDCWQYDYNEDQTQRMGDVPEHSKTGVMK